MKSTLKSNHNYIFKQALNRHNTPLIYLIYLQLYKKQRNVWLLSLVRHTLLLNLTSPHLSFQYIYYASFLFCNVFLTSEFKTYNYEVSITCTHSSILTYLYVYNFKGHTPISDPLKLFAY